MKVVNLSVHKNNMAQRKRKEGRQIMKTCVKDMARTDCTSGFYFISWNENGGFQDRLYDQKGIIGRNRLPDYVRGAAQRMIGQIDNEDR